MMANSNNAESSPPSDRLCVGQTLGPDQRLLSTNGKYQLSFDIKPIKTGSGNSLNEAYMCISNLTDNTSKYFMLGERPDGEQFHHAVLTDRGWIEIFEKGGNVVRRSVDNTEKERREQFDRHAFNHEKIDRQWDPSLLGWSYYCDFELVMQDDGALAIQAKYDWELESHDDEQFIRREMRWCELRDCRYSIAGRWKESQRASGRNPDRRPERPFRVRDAGEQPYKKYDGEDLKILGYFRSQWWSGREPSQKRLNWFKENGVTPNIIWINAKMRSLPTAFSPDKTFLKAGEKLLMGERLSFPSGSASFGLQEDGFVTLRAAGGKTLFKSFPQNARPGVVEAKEYLIINEHGELIHYHEGIVNREEANKGDFAKIGSGDKVKWREPFKDDRWHSHLFRHEPTTGGKEKVLKLTMDGNAVLYIGDMVYFNTKNR